LILSILCHQFFADLYHRIRDLGFERPQLPLE
jgi:hypothetical protein